MATSPCMVMWSFAKVKCYVDKQQAVVACSDALCGMYYCLMNDHLGGR